MDNDRLYTLDAMRGIAAILVVACHAGNVTFPIAPAGYLAVDFFFCLSGFVLAKAYQNALRSGLGFGPFMLKRLIRLYPMFILGVGFAVVKAIGQIATGDDNASLSLAEIALALVTEVVMLPTIAGGIDLFPLNGPAWSLFIELLINIAFAAVMFRVRRRLLTLVAAIGAVGVIAAALIYGDLNVGWGWANAWAGPARVLFSFTAGVLIYRNGIIQGRPSWLAVIPVFALATALIVPVGATLRPIIDIITALVLSPILVQVGTTLTAPKRLRSACNTLGDLSYPLYAVHFPLIFIGGFVAKKLGLPDLVWVPALIGGLAVFGWMLGRWIDPPVRRWLTITANGNGAHSCPRHAAR